MIPVGCPLLLFIKPLDAVDKATAQWWRLILEAYIFNEYQDQWGVWYFSISPLAALLDFCDIMFAEELRTRITSAVSTAARENRSGPASSPMTSTAKSCAAGASSWAATSPRASACATKP